MKQLAKNREIGTSLTCQSRKLLEKSCLRVYVRNIAQNLQRNVISTTIDRETIYRWMHASCTSLQPRARIETTATLDATRSLPAIALAFVFAFAFENHVDVTFAQMTIDDTQLAQNK